MVSVDILYAELSRRGRYIYLLSVNASKLIFPGDTIKLDEAIVNRILHNTQAR